MVGERSPPLNSEHPGGGPEEEELPGASRHWMGHWGRVWVLVPECKAQKWRPKGALGLGVFCCVCAGRGVYLSPSPPLPGGLTGPLPQILTVILTQQHSGHCPAWAGEAGRAGPAKYLGRRESPGPSPGQSAFPRALAGSWSCPPPRQEAEALAPMSHRASTLPPERLRWSGSQWRPDRPAAQRQGSQGLAGCPGRAPTP